MTLAILVAVLAAATFSVVGCAGAANKSTRITVTGSTTVLPIAEVAAEQYMKANAGTEIFVSGVGSSEGIEAVSTGRAEIGTSSRDLKPEESGAGLVDHPIALDAIAVIVNPSNPVSDLTTEQVAAIFEGKITNWNEVGGLDMEIGLVNRDEASGTREAFSKKVLAGADFDPAAAVLPGTGQVRSVVAESASAIGYISLGFVESEFTSETVKAIAINGIAPTEANVAGGTYPISRKLHFFTKGEPTGLTKAYLDYVLSAQVQESVVRDAGFLPITTKGQ